MKHRAVFTAIAVLISVYLVSSYAGISVNSSVSRSLMPSSRAARQSAPAAARAPYPGATSTGRAAMDPNKVAAAVRAFPGLEQELMKVSRGSRAEVTEWLRPISTTTDNRSRLAREVQKQVAIELDFLRKIANEEGAKKTAAAIDGIQLVRESRLKKLSEKMEEEKRSARREASLARTPRGRRSRASGTDEATTDDTTSGYPRRRR